MVLLEEKEAIGTTKVVYDDVRQTFGMKPNLFKAIAAAALNGLK